MTAVNVTVPVDDPDLLREGGAPEAPFEVRYIQLYRYGSEIDARHETNETLVDTGGGFTWELVASGTAKGEPDISGPYRYGLYDSGQTASSWYTFRYANAGLDTFSLHSEPWESDNRPSLTLRRLLVEVGSALGDSMMTGEGEENSDPGEVVCPALFESSVRDPRLYEHWWVYVLSGAAEGQEAMIASVDTETGTVTLERELAAAVTEGDEIMVSCYMPVGDMIPVINRAREKMKLRSVHDIALTARHNRYPVPAGVRSETDVIDAVGVISHYNGTKQDEFPVGYRVVFDGHQGWVEFDTGVMFQTTIARLVCLRSYRDYEGELRSLDDETLAPVEWMRPAAAHAIATHLVKMDPEYQEYQRLESELVVELRQATGQYAPNVQRRVKSGSGRGLLPGPREIR